MLRGKWIFVDCNSNIFKYRLVLPYLRKQVYNQTLMGLMDCKLVFFRGGMLYTLKVLLSAT